MTTNLSMIGKCPVDFILGLLAAGGVGVALLSGPYLALLGQKAW